MRLGVNRSSRLRTCWVEGPASLVLVSAHFSREFLFLPLCLMDGDYGIPPPFYPDVEACFFTGNTAPTPPCERAGVFSHPPDYSGRYYLNAQVEAQDATLILSQNSANLCRDPFTGFSYFHTWPHTDLPSFDTVAAPELVATVPLLPQANRARAIRNEGVKKKRVEVLLHLTETSRHEGILQNRKPCLLCCARQSEKEI